MYDSRKMFQLFDVDFAIPYIDIHDMYLEFLNFTNDDRAKWQTTSFWYTVFGRMHVPNIMMLYAQ